MAARGNARSPPCAAAALTPGQAAGSTGLCAQRGAMGFLQLPTLLAPLTSDPLTVGDAGNLLRSKTEAACNPPGSSFLFRKLRSCCVWIFVSRLPPQHCKANVFSERTFFENSFNAHTRLRHQGHRHLLNTSVKGGRAESPDSSPAPACLEHQLPSPSS